MPNEDETATTTVDEETTTTTVDETTEDRNNEETETTTQPEHQGEVAIDKDARADIVGGNVDVAKSDERVQEENIEGAKQDAIANHKAEHSAPAEDDGENPNATQ